jgi:hypothetical protein
MTYELLSIASFGKLTVKERVGRQTRLERLPRFCVWEEDMLIKDFRKRADAIRYAKVNG